MNNIPDTDRTPVIRTDFSDDKLWRGVCAEIRKLPPELEAAFAKLAGRGLGLKSAMSSLPPSVDLVDDKQFANLSIDQLLERAPKSSRHTFLFVVDGTTIGDPDHPILVVDLYHQRGRSFRALPIQTRTIQDNLSLANMDWEDFANHVDPAGVFRGFPQPTS